MRLLAAVAAASAIGGFAVSVQVVTASAHSGAIFYASHWENDHTENWFFRDNVPGGNFRDRVKDGFAQWNNTPNDGNAEPNFDFSGEKRDSNQDWNNACQAGYSAVSLPSRWTDLRDGCSAGRPGTAARRGAG